jgi:hypothetical protein
VDECEVKLHQYIGSSPFPPTFAAVANISLWSAFNLDYTCPGRGIKIRSLKNTSSAVLVNVSKYMSKVVSFCAVNFHYFAREKLRKNLGNLCFCCCVRSFPCKNWPHL